MKKVIALHASKRKMNTYGLLRQIKELLAKEQIEVEIISLYDVPIKDCIGCERCILTGKCVLKDEAETLMTKLVEADGIILSSPVYLQQASGKMKTFIDRTCKWFHRPELYGKPILAVATTKGSGLKGTLNYLDKVGEQWGALSAGTIGRDIRSIEKPITMQEVSRFIKLIQAPETYSPTLSNLINFEVQKSLAQHLVGLDEAYWKEKGWQTKSYYFPCKVNYFKKSVSGTIGKSMRKGMARNQNKQVADTQNN